MTLGLAVDSQIMTPKAQTTKEKIFKLDCIKIKNFCASEDIIKKGKRQNYRMGENNCKSIILYLEYIKGPKSGIYKELLQLTSRDNPIKMGKGLKQTFF